MATRSRRVGRERTATLFGRQIAGHAPRRLILHAAFLVAHVPWRRPGERELLAACCRGILPWPSARGAHLSGSRIHRFIRSPRTTWQNAGHGRALRLHYRHGPVCDGSLWPWKSRNHYRSEIREVTLDRKKSL